MKIYKIYKNKYVTRRLNRIVMKWLRWTHRLIVEYCNE